MLSALLEVTKKKYYEINCCGCTRIRMVAPRLPPRDIVVVTPQLTVWYICGTYESVPKETTRESRRTRRQHATY